MIGDMYEIDLDSAGNGIVDPVIPHQVQRFTECLLMHDIVKEAFRFERQHGRLFSWNK